MEVDRWYRLRTPEFDYVFAANGGPIDDPQSAPELLQAIGHAVMSFGRFEHLLDAILAHVNQSSIDSNLYEDHPRTAFNRKVKILARWLTRHPPLASVAEKYADVLPSFATMWELRSALIHAYFQSYDPRSCVADVRRVRVERDGRIHWQEWDEPLADIQRLIQLTADGYQILRAIAEEVFPEAA